MCDFPDGLGCATTATAADGSYSFDHAETGDWTILAAPGHHVAGYFGPGGFASTAALATPVHLDAGGPDVTGIDISTPAGGAISGIVTGPRAAPLSGVSISFGSTSYPGQPRCISGTDGAYLCDGVAAGLYQVSLGAPVSSDELSGYYFAGGPGNYTSNGLDATVIKVTDTNDSVPPTIISRSPERTVHGVVRDASVAVGFSEDVIGIGPRTFQLEVDGTSTLLTGK